KAEKKSEQETERNVKTAELIEITDFGKVQLKIAKVLEAERIENSTKLLKLRIDLGHGDERQLVAGIAESYKPEEVLGRLIVVVANLKSAVIRGTESNGMLLAAKQGRRLKLVTVDGDIAPGATVG
ncbi:MAG: methionine--tRNA ligase subunit beta, partial [Victivallaceae bacterium]|nr:methionine--tRNA ligase subunit beta [Victivallaceae bacterium]